MRFALSLETTLLPALVLAQTDGVARAQVQWEKAPVVDTLRELGLRAGPGPRLPADRWRGCAGRIRVGGNASCASVSRAPGPV
jgi:hypothetical protein